MPHAQQSHAPPTTRRNVALGAGTLFAEIALSFVIAALVKIAQADISVFAILVCRYIFCLPLLFIYGWHRRGVRILVIHNKRVMAWRTVFGLLGLTTWFLALGLIDLSLATALSQTVPILITVLAVPMLGESVGFRQILAVIAGFFGVMLLLDPVGVAFMPGEILGLGFALICPLFVALMFIHLRRLGQSESPISTALWYNMVGVVYAGILAIADGSMASLLNGTIPLQIWVILIAVGIIASLQQMFMALSHAFAPASTLAPVHYTAVPLGVGIGIVFFGETLSLLFILGVAVILLANYAILKN